MWHYISSQLDSINRSGKNIYRVFISNGEISESFFLEYSDAPDETKIKQDVDRYLASRDQTL